MAATRVTLICRRWRCTREQHEESEERKCLKCATRSTAPQHCTNARPMTSATQAGVDRGRRGTSYGATSSGGGGGSPGLVNAPDDSMNLASEAIPFLVLSSKWVPMVCGE